MAEEVLVRIQAQAELAFGEDLFLCGSVPAFGSWDVPKAAPMTWSEGGRWTAEVSLPCGVCMELKVIVRSHSGVRWLGVGPNGSENLVLETGLGREGGRGSRLVTSDPPPLGLSVEDAGLAAPATGSTGGAAGSGLMAANAAHRKELAASPAPAVTMAQQPEAAAPPPHVAAAMLAGNAAVSTGRAVTYATTTTTTTYVTVSGAEGIAGGGQHVPQPCVVRGAPGDGANGANGGFAPLPGAGGDALAAGRGTAIADHAAGTAPALQDKAEGGCVEKRLAGAATARKANTGVPRMGIVPLAWRRDGPEEVFVAGSWDGWSRQIALEPLSAGGFGVVLALAPGEYECKFIVDGVWLACEELDVKGQHGNNVFNAGDTLLLPAAPAEMVAASSATALAVR